MSNRLIEIMKARNGDKTNKKVVVESDAVEEIKEMTSGEINKLKFEESMKDDSALILLLDQIVVENQVRHSFDKIEERSKSIKQDGLLQPIVVELMENGKYRLYMGECRYRAMRLLEKENPLKYGQIRATLRKTEDDPIERKILQCIENLQRDNLKNIELANAAKEIMIGRDWTQEQVAKRFNVSKSEISKALTLLEMDEDLKEAVQDGDKSAHAARVEHQERVADKKKTPAQISAKSVSSASNKKVKIQKISISISEIKSTCIIFQKLAKQLNLPDIEISNDIGRKELLQIMEQRTQEIKKAFI